MTLLFSFMMYCYTLQKCSLISLLFHKTTIQHNIQHASNSSMAIKTKESISANIVKIVHYLGVEIHFLFRSILPKDTSNYYIYMYFLPTEQILSRQLKFMQTKCQFGVEITHVYVPEIFTMKAIMPSKRLLQKEHQLHQSH